MCCVVCWSKWSSQYRGPQPIRLLVDGTWSRSPCRRPWWDCLDPRWLCRIDPRCCRLRSLFRLRSSRWRLWRTWVGSRWHEWAQAASRWSRWRFANSKDGWISQSGQWPTAGMLRSSSGQAFRPIVLLLAGVIPHWFARILLGSPSLQTQGSILHSRQTNTHLWPAYCADRLVEVPDLNWCPTAWSSRPNVRWTEPGSVVVILWSPAPGCLPASRVPELVLEWSCMRQGWPRQSVTLGSKRRPQIPAGCHPSHWQQRGLAQAAPACSWYQKCYLGTGGARPLRFCRADTDLVAAEPADYRQRPAAVGLRTLHHLRRDLTAVAVAAGCWKRYQTQLHFLQSPACSGYFERKYSNQTFNHWFC